MYCFDLYHQDNPAVSLSSINEDNTQFLPEPHAFFWAVSFIPEQFHNFVFE